MEGELTASNKDVAVYFAIELKITKRRYVSPLNREVPNGGIFRPTRHNYAKFQ